MGANSDDALHLIAAIAPFLIKSICSGMVEHRTNIYLIDAMGIGLVSDTRTLLIKKSLEATKNVTDLFGLSKISHGVRNRIVIFQT
jgi:hypothetical protein